MSKLFYFGLIFWIGSFSVSAQFSSLNRAERQLAVLQKETEPLYRRPTGKELKLVEPRRELADKYGEVLRQPGTGLTKLIHDKGCAESTKVIVATADCLKYTMPGAGSSFSFREETYRIPRLADLTFTDNSFQATGILLHGIFVNIGDVPLESVTLLTPGIAYAAEFQPAVEFEKARELDRRLSEGVRHEGFIYRRALFARENATFVLRSIAYGGKLYRSIRGVTYNELDFDKRRDVLVAFRIVEKDAEGNITILWKRLWQKDSPNVRKDDERIAKP